MPRRTPSACAQPGCPEITSDTRCDEHRRERRRNEAKQRRAAGDPAMTVYQNDTWRSIRKRHLRDHPHCASCGAPSAEVDHITPRRQLEEHDIHEPDHDRWLQALCSTCHRRKSVTEDGALGRKVKRIEER